MHAVVVEENECCLALSFSAAAALSFNLNALELLFGLALSFVLKLLAHFVSLLEGMFVGCEVLFV